MTEPPERRPWWLTIPALTFIIALFVLSIWAIWELASGS